MTIVPIVIDSLGTITKGLLKGLEDLEVGGRVETIQMIALLRTARILRRVLESWGDLLSLKLQWKPSANTDVKNSKGVNNNNNNIETHKILSDFEIQTHHLISPRGPDLVTVKKKKEPTE